LTKVAISWKYHGHRWQPKLTHFGREPISPRCYPTILGTLSRRRPGAGYRGRAWTSEKVSALRIRRHAPVLAAGDLRHGVRCVQSLPLPLPRLPATVRLLEL